MIVCVEVQLDSGELQSDDLRLSSITILLCFITTNIM